MPYSPARYPDVSCFWGWEGDLKKKKKLWNCSTYFVTKDAKLCNCFFFPFLFFCYAHSMYFFLFFFIVPYNNFFFVVAFRHVLHDLLSVNVKPLSYLIFVLGTHIVSSLWIVVCGGRRYGGDGEEGKKWTSVCDTSHRKWSEPCFVHLNGVWISYANSFVTLQILMYLNKCNIQITKLLRNICINAHFARNRVLNCLQILLLNCLQILLFLLYAPWWLFSDF